MPDRQLTVAPGDDERMMVVEPHPALRAAGGSLVRLDSLDLARGITVMAMVVVNSSGNGAHVYRLLRHARWNGIAGADLVFPAFVTLLGASLWLSNESDRCAETRPRTFVARLLRRSVLLVCLGLSLHLFPRPDFAELRIPGVLQRLGIITLVVGLALRFLTKRQQRAVAAAIIVTYAVLLRWVPVPGFGHAAMTATQNWPGWLDICVFGQLHVYANGGYDPEGILSTLSAAVAGLGGAWAIRSLVQRRRLRAPVFWCALAFVAGLFAATVNPINKRMWTPSFGAITCAVACGLLITCELAARHRQQGPLRRVATNMGKRSLEIYLLSEVANDALHRYHPPFAHRDSLRGWSYRRFAEVLPANAASLAYALTLLAVWCAIAAVLVKRRWRLRL